MTNSTSHRATPEQWGQIERFVADCGYDSCLLELRDRLTAAEQRISELERDATCPHIRSGDEGSSYCALAEATAAASPPTVTRRPLREPSAATIAECGGPCEQGFWNCDCGLLEKLNPDLRPASSVSAGSLVEVA